MPDIEETPDVQPEGGETPDENANDQAAEPEGSADSGGAGESEEGGEPQDGETATEEGRKPADDEAGEPDGVPDVDKAITEALKDHPEALKAVQDRWRLQWRGIEKREAKLEAREAEADAAKAEAESVRQALGEGVEPKDAGDLVAYWQRLTDPKHAPEMVPDLLKRMADMYDTTVEELAGIESEGVEAWERKGFDSKGQYLHYLETKRANDLRERNVRGADDSAAKVPQSAPKPHGDAGYAAVAAKIKGEKAGFTVSREMFDEAVRELPQFRDDPAKAVRKWFGEDIERHMLKVSAKSRQAGHNMPADRSQGKGASRPQGRPGSFRETMKRLEQQGRL